MASRRRYSVSILDLLQKGYLRVNDEIFHDWIRGPHKNKQITAKILENGDIVILDTEIRFKSLTSAARFYRNSPTNGWKWWFYKSEGIHRVSLHDLREKYMKSEC